MRPRNQRIRDVLALCVLALLLGNESCEEESGTPVADAGADLTIDLGQPAQLDGSASTDPDAGSLVFHWNLESKPVTSAMANSSFSKNTSADASQTSFVPDVPGTYGVSLYVANEGEHSSDLDYVVVIAGSTNTLPVADAGVDVEAGVDEVAYLDGSASSDPEGAALQYEWSFDLVPADSALTESDLFNQGSPEAAVVPDVVGQFVLRLRVYDGEFWSTPDFVTVSAVESNQPPIANADESFELTPCSSETVDLDGRASYDPEGADVTYNWEMVSVPAGSQVSTQTMDGEDTGSPSFTWDLVGLYTARLVVSDGNLDSTPDYVAIRTVDHEPNDGPVADAGGNILIEASAYCSGSCSPCGEREELLDGSDSWDPDNDSLDYTWDITSGPGEVNGEHAEQAELVIPSLETTPNNTSVSVTTVELTVMDCQGEPLADSQEVTVTFRCTGNVY